MIMGFPGTTNRYMTSFEVNDATYNYLPANIALRKLKLDILKEHMDQDANVRLKYATMYSHLASTKCLRVFFLAKEPCVVS